MMTAYEMDGIVNSQFSVRTLLLNGSAVEPMEAMIKLVYDLR